MCLGEGVKSFFSYFFFFSCIRGTGRDLMGGFFCSIGVQRCIASRFSTTSQARLISNQILLLNYFPPSQAGGGLFRLCNEQVYQSELAQVSIPQAGGGLFRPYWQVYDAIGQHYSGTLKSRHFPRNCPWNLPVQKESWKDISKEPPCPRNSPWNLPRSRKDLRAVLTPR